MRCEWISGRLLPLAGAFCALVVLTPTEADAQVAPVVFHACYVPNSGNVYRVGEPNTPATCVSPQHIGFSWRDRGLAGPAGPVGPQGPQGAQGAAGSVGWETVTAEFTFPHVTRFMGGSVNCPAGKRPFGGGLLLGGEASGDAELHHSFPTANGWHVTVASPLYGGPTWRVQAVCANATAVKESTGLSRAP